MTGRIIFSVCILGLLFFTGVTPAMALEIHWKPANDDNADYTQRAFATTNKVDIKVYVDHAKDVEINGEEAQEEYNGSDSWIRKDCVLEPGENTIEATAELYGNKQETEEFNLTLIDEPVSGAVRYFESINEGITAFKESLKLELPEDTIVMYNDRAAWSQGITVKISKPLFKLTPQYVPLSPLYSISAASQAYSLSDAGKLTINYDHTGSAANSMITVLYALPNLPYPQAMQRLHSFNISDGSITVPFSKNGFGHYLVVRVIKDFQDFYLQKQEKAQLEWARPYVMELWSRGIMDKLEQYPDGTPVPQGYFGLADSSGESEIPVTRKEFVKMLARGLRLPVSTTSLFFPTFNDLQGLGAQEKMYIEAAVKAGWIPTTMTKTGKLLFHPADPLTRKQAGVIMARAANLELPAQARADQMMQAYFPADFASTYSWNRPEIIACLQAGLIPLTRQGYFDPDKPVTRAGAAMMVYKLMVKTDKL